MILYAFTLFILSVASTAPGVTLEPKMKDLANRVAAVIPHKWKMVAIQLDVDMGAIDRIESDKCNSFDRIMAVFDCWKRSSCEPYTWKTLVTALKSRSVDEVKLAEELQHDFC